MKQFKMNLVMLVVLSLAFNVRAQDSNGNQPASPNEEDPTVEEFLNAIPIEMDLADSESETVPGKGEDAPPADSATTPAAESFSKQGTTSPRFVSPMKGGTNAASNGAELDPNSLAARPTPADKVVKDGEKGLRLNFRGAPLDLVLSYLSDAAGFIIVPEADVKGKVDLWSNQPVTKDEAIELLNKVLGKEGYAVLRDGRTLTIVTQSEAKKRDIPVKMGYEPANIPKDQQVVTQIIPVRFINAVQLAKDLQPLMASQTTMTANEGGNALVITDAQQNIRRLAEIIKALDTTVNSMSSVKVFSMRFADAKTVAEMVKEVFGGSSSSSGSSGGRGEFRFGDIFGGGRGDRGGSSSSGTSGRPGASKVVATADERSNSLVVSAPDDLMPTIEQLVTSVDTNVEDVTEIRVFRLMHADPQETSDLLGSLFPDPSTQSSRNNSSFGFFRGPFGDGGDRGGSSTGSQSDRLKKQTKVISVPDLRTRSVVVTAARDTMEQISKMITQLDSDPARKQKVFVYEVQNTDPTTVQQTLEDLFSGQSTSSSRSRTTSGQPGSQLNTRAQQQNQGTTRNNNSSFGGGNSSGSSGTRSFGN